MSLTKPKPFKTTLPTNKGNGGDRQKKIVEAMRIKKELTIKDISFIFPEITEKTLQRDIMSLIDKNVVMRVGDKRWSKYKLAN